MLDPRGIQAFVTVAEHRSFSAAARALAVTPSALSQAVRAFEDRVGVPLLSRTTRSVSLTDAGRRLLTRLTPVLHEAEAALEEARGSTDLAQGTLRISVGGLVAPLVIEPVIGKLLAAHPGLSIEISVDDRFVDIVAGGFDAGIRVRGFIEHDFTIVRLTPPFRFVVAGAPSYLDRRGRPVRPRDLLGHDCINYRRSGTGTFAAWKFERRGQKQEVAVSGRIACNEGSLIQNMALAGHGLLYLPEPALVPHLESGALEVVLQDYAVLISGFFLYFPRRTGLQPKLRAFIEIAKELLGARGYVPKVRREK